MFKVLTQVKVGNYISMLCVYTLCLYILIYQASFSFFNISTYYQIISFLNTKNNIYIIYLIFLILLENRLKLKRVNKIFLILIFFLVILNSTNLFDNNKLLLFWLTNSNNNLNLNLINGLMLIHPILLYIFYIYFIYLIYFNFIKSASNKKDFFKNQKNLIFLNNFLILISISLGCWWAEQELSWGGWWSWDFVEIIALNFLLYFLFLIHSNGIATPLKNIRFIKLQTLLLLISITSVRFNIINSIHNFISLESQNQYFYYILMLVLCWLVLLVIYLCFLNNFGNGLVIIRIIFTICLCIFYINYIYNLLNTNIIYIFFKLDINVKHIYINTTLFVVLLYMLKNKNTNIKVLLYLIFFIFFKKNLNLLDFVIYFIICYIFYNCFNQSNSKLQIKHVLITLFIYLTFYQVFIFNKDYTIFLNSNLFSIKASNHLYTSSVNIIYDYNFSYTDIKTCIDYVSDTKKNTKLFDENFFKNIFEKKMSTGDTLNELYSYNLQQLSQINGFILIVLIVTIIIVTFVILFKSSSVTFF